MNLNEFARDVHALAVEKGFYDPPPSEEELIAAIHGEISEAFEAWRSGKPMVYFGTHNKPEGIAVELIDVVLRHLDAAAEWEMTLTEAADVGQFYNTVAIDKLSLPELTNWLHKLVGDYDIAIPRDLSNTIAVIFRWLRAHDIDPEALMLAKHTYNKTRPYKHGGKRI